MKIIVTGASGFIGQNIMEHLAGSFQIESVSLRKSDWQHSFQGAFTVINLVGKAHNHKGVATKNDYFYANLELTKQIFQCFITSSATLMIHVSSLAALEEFESTIPLTEENSCAPDSWYGKSKRAAEIWLLDQPLPENKKLIILRPPMVHGPGDKGNLGLLYNLISKGIPYPLAAFNNLRSFISIDNFGFLIKQIISHQEIVPTGIYHITDDEAVSTNDLIEIIRAQTGKKGITLSLPKAFVKLVAKTGDLIPLPLNTNRLKKLTGTLLVSNKKIKSVLKIEKLPITAREGLVNTIKSFQKK
ncbi:NAD-dependent epimerase/dehydratase family protein [Niabella drilacis]|uniref:Nucleoside-diphosphate-sugar epimerase n=1 Tax=Niabella drilacis (strain DSM 25811 / CCM 8410 / CCUG 62505 / LMG 26954 / E90) TaxID=1285928 RepID=A0A1G6QUT3_NIADE|nr:NAD-dependent epimerase/dehydratase family protein [Niabella drilacis]SDC95654.1 Nucleoside-diphosphate-sugar epimerase [Niabella drilacis]